MGLINGPRILQDLQEIGLLSMNPSHFHSKRRRFRSSCGSHASWRVSGTSSLVIWAHQRSLGSSEMVTRDATNSSILPRTATHSYTQLETWIKQASLSPTCHGVLVPNRWTMIGALAPLLLGSPWRSDGFWCCWCCGGETLREVVRRSVVGFLAVSVLVGSTHLGAGHAGDFRTRLRVLSAPGSVAIVEASPMFPPSPSRSDGWIGGHPSPCPFPKFFFFFFFFLFFFSYIFQHFLIFYFFFFEKSEIDNR